jgi:hypothetical protein
MAWGRKTGGRKRGTPNKRSVRQLQAAVAGGAMPLDFLLSVVRAEALPIELRLDAARAAAPFMHHKLSALQHVGQDGGPIRVQGTMVIDFSADV